VELFFVVRIEVVGDLLKIFALELAPVGLGQFAFKLYGHLFLPYSRPSPQLWG
jgi:hypothetical protein